MIRRNSRLPLVGDRWSDPIPHVKTKPKTKPKIKTFLRGEKQQSLPPSGASRWSALGCRKQHRKGDSAPDRLFTLFRLILQ
jgi:hypothetical protein